MGAAAAETGQRKAETEDRSARLSPTYKGRETKREKGKKNQRKDSKIKVRN